MKKFENVLSSSEPLPNQMIGIKRMYLICLAVVLIGILVKPLLGIGLLLVIITYIVDYFMLSFRKNALRAMKFKFDSTVTYDDLYNRVAPILTSQYEGVSVSRDKNGKMVVEYEGHLYDLTIENDNTFTIWWRKSVTKALFSLREYKSYKRILKAMGIIGYEIQKNFEISN